MKENAKTSVKEKNVTKARVNSKHIVWEDCIKPMEVVVHAKVCSKQIDEAYLKHGVQRKAVESKMKYKGNKVVESITG